MPFLGLIVGLVTLVAVWYWRVKAAGEVAGELVDAAARARGAYRRARFRSRAEGSTLTAIEDPAVAAAVLLVAVAEEAAPLTDAQAAAIRRWLHDTAGDAGAAETLVFARWAAARSAGFDAVFDALAPLFRQALAADERAQLMEMASALSEGVPAGPRATMLRRLRNGLKLVPSA